MDTGDGRPTDTVLGGRRHLINLAYRLLGSPAEAEDAVQEAYARWYAMAPERRQAVEVPGAWLTTVVSRICLDVLGSARVRRERYVGEWLPEPLPDRAEWPGAAGGASADPADRITLDESVGMAFLVVLESMTPAERVVFVLHDVFRYPFPEIAVILDRTAAACRQLASSARRRVRAARTPSPGQAPSAAQAPTAAQAPASGQDRQAEVVRKFRKAWESQDIEALVGLLDPAATLVADGGGLVSAVVRPVEGGPRIAQYLVLMAAMAPGLTLLERTVNGLPGLVAQRDGVTATVAALDVVDGRITRIWAVRNPAKLTRWTAAGDVA
ncbi:RNA polymerase sigma factor SigJ [Kitasatospora sp. NPDC004723]|uniref:RNA polymerase sigma factor SigJ n=1 Tax=Kitasatospora sp. NPDC004723 TaxID=3154288 RepID=UPI0033B15467